MHAPRPFLDVLDVDTKATQRLWRSTPPHYEYTSSILSDADSDAPVTLDSLRLLGSRESVEEPPQYLIKRFERDALGNVQLAAERCISSFKHP